MLLFSAGFLLPVKILVRIIAAIFLCKAALFTALQSFADVAPAPDDQTDERAERKSCGYQLQYQPSGLSHSGYPLVVL